MSEEALRKTPLEALHKELGARMVPFAGFLMPVQYAGIVEEHLTVRRDAGLFDVSHMGQLRFRGRDALACLQWLTTNDVAKLINGQAQYSLLCKEDGTVIDDIIIYRLAEDHYFVCVNASNTEKDFTWCASQAKAKGFQVDVGNESDRYALLALQGPKAQAILQELTKADLASLRAFHFIENTVGKWPVFISRTGYTGEDGFELYVAPENAPALWTELMKVGASRGLKPIGLGARDTLRLEVKFALYGNDLDESHTAIEAGLGWVVKTEKGAFLGQRVLAEQKKAGAPRKLVGFRMKERSVPRHGYAVFTDDRATEAAGIVTSGTHSPSLDCGIGCAYVESRFAAPGTPLQIDIRGKRYAAEVVKTPFYPGRKGP